MKGYAAAAPPLAKRRWKGFALAVFTLVLSSMLFPLFFLGGLHHRFPSTAGYLNDDHSAPDSSVRSFDESDSGRENPDVRKILNNTDGHVHKEGVIESISSPLSKETPFHSGGVSHSQTGGKEPLPFSSTKMSKSNKKMVKNGDDTEELCQIKFGSYCLWSMEHKEKMKDLMVKKLKDQLFVARGYFPIIAKLKSQEKLSQEIKQHIQDHERMLAAALVDSDLPLDAEKKFHRMKEALTRGKALHMDCSYVEKKLRQILDLTEDEALFHMRQSAFLYHLGVQTMPKSHHCLSMRLTVESFKSPSVDVESSHTEKLDNPSLHHYVIFSKNILASSVAINSTVMSAKGSGNMVFHLLTDRQNYFSMKFWFSRNSYKNAVIHVQNIEDYALANSYGSNLQPHLSMSEEFRIFIQHDKQVPAVQSRTEYISVFGHAHFLLPDIFKNLRRLIVLNDDVVVQKDLSPLWDLDLRGKVISAMEFCRVRMGQLKSYFVGKEYDKETCLWMSGLNIVDLDKWREHNVSRAYQQSLHQYMKLQERDQTTWRIAALPTSLLAFQGLVYPLNNSWVLSGLGTNYGVHTYDIKKAAVLHYNGNMKPWLELGIPRYKGYWQYFLARGNQFMDECNKTFGLKQSRLSELHYPSTVHSKDSPIEDHREDVADAFNRPVRYPIQSYNTLLQASALAYVEGYT
ncbi:hypothetical protein Taro_024990 [Colocasia esculenta]|uniref:Hexosyltransferase n=1 Tax=Colocasia esculenta TaxID=4460 RepID=A0A843V891_COLES|nr:hypothetical protein [Colocasia esculenta]